MKEVDPDVLSRTKYLQFRRCATRYKGEDESLLYVSLKGEPGKQQQVNKVGT